MPDLQLFTLPFAALRDAGGRHLVERHTVRVAPSIGVLRQLQRAGRRRHAVGVRAPSPAAAARAEVAEAAVVGVGDPGFADGDGLEKNLDVILDLIF